MCLKVLYRYNIKQLIMVLKHYPNQQKIGVHFVFFFNPRQRDLFIPLEELVETKKFFNGFLKRTDSGHVLYLNRNAVPPKGQPP